MFSVDPLLLFQQLTQDVFKYRGPNPKVRGNRRPSGVATEQLQAPKVPKFLLKDLWLQFFQHPFPFCFCRTCHDFAVCSFLASPPKNGECP